MDDASKIDHKIQSVSLGIGQYPVSLEKKGKNFY